jgi:hypothetical protein
MTRWNQPRSGFWQKTQNNGDVSQLSFDVRDCHIGLQYQRSHIVQAIRDEKYTAIHGDFVCYDLPKIRNKLIGIVDDQRIPRSPG